MREEIGEMRWMEESRFGWPGYLSAGELASSVHRRQINASELHDERWSIFSDTFPLPCRVIISSYTKRIYCRDTSLSENIPFVRHHPTAIARRDSKFSRIRSEDTQASTRPRAGNGIFIERGN